MHMLIVLYLMPEPGVCVSAAGAKRKQMKALPNTRIAVKTAGWIC